MTKESSEEKHCLNCGEVLTKDYCGNCGQKRTHLNVPFKHLLSDFLGNVFTFDAKFFRTFVPLLTKPGLLTVRFNAGQRVRYVSPFRLYLFISVIFFFTLALSDVKLFKVTKMPKAQDTDAKVQPNTETRTDPVAPDTSEVQLREDSERDRSASKALKDKFFTNLKKASENPELVNAILVRRLPQLMFLMVPVFALFVKLMYWRSDPFYVNHLVFGLYFHSFAFLILFVMKLFFMISHKPIVMLLAFAIPVYLFLSLKRVYSQSIVMTISKLLVLLVCYIVVVFVSIIFVAFGTILLYE